MMTTYTENTDKNKKLYLIKYGEIGLKGNNRHIFEKKLVTNIREKLNRKFNNCQVKRKPGRVFVEVAGNKEEVLKALSQVFGIVGVAPVEKVNLNLEHIKETALKMVKLYLKNQSPCSFRIEARRANKKFHLTSPEIDQKLGAHILENTDKLSVDLTQPDFRVNVEIRNNYAYLYLTEKEGVGGLPRGISGKGVLMLSGGIDSPVAGWLAMKRGMAIIPLYFHSFPFTSDRAREKVIELATILADYAGPFSLYIAHFTEAQTALQKNCHSSYITILMRRLMVAIADKLAHQIGALGLFTGESIGQVASQTLEALQVTDAVSTLPIFRPLICYDKQEIVSLAKKIGTYETSILPYEDCCTVFVPHRPVTKPQIEKVKQEEAKINFNKLVAECIDNIEKVDIKP